MDVRCSLYNKYVQILKEELRPAMGCTEPIAIAYGAAKAREVLGTMPDSVLVEASGNIIKNVKSVVVPNTGGLKGIEVAAAAGIVAGDASKQLEVISSVTAEQLNQLDLFLKEIPIKVEVAKSAAVFDLVITLKNKVNSVSLRIMDYHTNIVSIVKNGETIYQGGCSNIAETSKQTDRTCLDVKDIVDFVETCDVEDIREVVGRQIEYNWKIAEEGIKGNWGANVGSVILNHYGNDTHVRARAYAAAGSDARMSGCELPVIIVSGSGNQGITASVPVIVYAKELNASEETLLRAVALSDLLTVHVKTGIGTLSAYCGAISAGACAGAAISWLLGGGYRHVSHTLVNALAVVSGVVCDGAKPSCAAKIATAVDAGILGCSMIRDGQQFHGGEGIVHKGVEATIDNVSKLGHDGMRETDKKILEIMTEEN